MNSLKYLVVFLLLAFATVNSYRHSRRSNTRERSRPSSYSNNNQTSTSSTLSNRSRRPPRLFDDFLKMVVSSGRIPDIYNGGTQSSNNTNDQSQNSAAQLTNPARSTLRNYIRHHRAEPFTNTTSEVGSGSLSDPDQESDIYTLASQRVRSRIAEPIRRHSRRSMSSARDVETSLRGISREHWNCCQLGNLAGDKGFLCDAQFYASRVIDRNANRVHNRRLTNNFFRNGENTDAGTEMLNTFNRCVRTPQTASEFQRCCSESARNFEAVEQRWNNFRCVFGGSHCASSV